MSYACARSAAYSLASVSFPGVCGTVGEGLWGVYSAIGELGVTEK